MTQRQRGEWITAGQGIATMTIVVLLVGFAVSVARAQYPGSAELQQAATNAMLSAQITALSDRLGKVEGQLNFLLMGIVGAVLTQIIVLRTARRS